MMRCHGHSRTPGFFGDCVCRCYCRRNIHRGGGAGCCHRTKDLASKAGCPQCHGWSGDGHVSGFESPGGLPLRTTQLTRDQIREVIQCGRPGTPMPHFDRFAYTDKRCYDMTAEDLGKLEAIRADTTLQPFEIDAVADYVATKIKGTGPVTRGECTEFFGETGAECEKYPDQPASQKK